MDYNVDKDIRKARTLPSVFYKDVELFNKILSLFKNQWHFATHKSSLTNHNIMPLPHIEQILNESMILTKQNNDYSCLSNVCTHRGMLICDEACSSTILKCGYHGRTFSLDGHFSNMPEFDEVIDFPSSDDNLTSFPLKDWKGLLFTGISLSDFQKYISFLNHKLNLLHEYNKNKLVPFGEFLPFEKFLKKIGLKKISYGYQSFSSAKKRELIFIDNKNFNFIPLICYEIIYSGKITSKFNNTDFIINISEDGWFGNSIGPHQHFSHSIFRAIEEGKNIIRSANNGISAYIDSNGIILTKLESTQKGVIEINNYKKLDKTFFSKFGNKIFFYFILIYISLLFFIYKRKR